MKKLVLFLAVILLFFACEKGGMNNTQKKSGKLETKNVAVDMNAPKIVFDETSYDGGEIIEGEKLPHEFKFRNEGKGVLTLTNVRSTCGCTVAKPDKKNYNPGEEGTIKVIFNSHGYKGNVIKTVNVFTNDPLQPKISLTLKCFVKKYIDFNPRFLSFGNINMGSKKTMSMIFRGGVEKQFKITKIEFPVQLKDITTYKITKLPNEDKVSAYKVDITINPKKVTMQSFGYSFLVHTDSKHVPVIPIQIRGVFVGPISYFPKAVNYTLKRGTYFVYTINLYSDKKFIIKSARFNGKESDKGVRVKVNEIKRNSVYSITLFSNSPLLQGVHGQLIINTSLNEQSRIILPVNVRVL